MVGGAGRGRTHDSLAGREHELTHNRVRDYAATPGGIQAAMRVSKSRPRVVPVPYGSRPSICPVRAWTAWREAAGLDDPGGYAWRCLHARWHTVMQGGLQPESIGDDITGAASAPESTSASPDTPRAEASPRSSRLKGP
ncbi:hypothetical protein ACFV9D_27480 [Streptomyces sp. NPDC059875]|uniref:hypothetical protein n=1 Tax=unclassified Streptomyces TaxID=2593676 RepID=UPI00365B1010